jgi:hypothetical protein
MPLNLMMMTIPLQHTGAGRQRLKSAAGSFKLETAWRTAVLGC